jgi:hypothetical protein
MPYVPGQFRHLSPRIHPHKSPKSQYFHTGAKSEAGRNTAGKYARILDYLYRERINTAAATDYIRDEGGPTRF